MQRTAKSSRRQWQSSIEDLNSVYGCCLAKSLIKLCDDDCSRSAAAEWGSRREGEWERNREREWETEAWLSKVAPAEVIRLSDYGCGCGSLPDCKMAVLPAASAATAAFAAAASAASTLHLSLFFSLSFLSLSLFACFLAGYCDGSCCLAATWKTH